MPFAQRAVAPKPAPARTGPTWKARPEASGTKALLRRACASEECSRKRLQREATSAGPDVAPPSVREALSSPGQPLERATRAEMEPRFGHSFGDVRVHADARAAASARDVQARAYTVGRDVVFASGRYAPATLEGQRLLAHELAHVVQQHDVPAAKPELEVGRVDDPAEREADRAADAVVAGGVASVGRAPGGGVQRQEEPATDQTGGGASAQERLCGPDVTSSIAAMLGTVEPWFRGLTGFQQARSCMGLGPLGFAVGVNPMMAWDTEQLFLPNTGWLDSYFRRSSCGSPRDAGCDTDPTRHLCETSGTCGNSVVVGGKCLLAGTANYALFGKMCRVCHDLTGRWNRWDMRAIIGAYKTVAFDDSTPPKEVASAAFDGTFPTLPAAAENRGTCTGRCGATHGGAFDFIWEPYRPR